MKLRKLRVCGFKSFADRTEFDFLDGVTVVVGPNGCGKSNVVDAVKWTLGEQSAKSLRGKEMLDVIFNGSVGRKAAAFAETTLTFENNLGLLGEHPVVEVSRRLYRTGESEYLLNKNASRLRDIKELFMGTGVGVDAYSVIEQGKVDILLAANPQERRLIFEEAAGISKQKAKKKEALRKLERVQANLSRLADINEEVDKRLRSLRIQAGKARNYKEHADRLKVLRVRWSVAEWHKLVAERAESRRRLQAALARRAAAESEHRAAADRHAGLAGRLAEIDDAVNALRVAAADGRARIAAAEDRIAAGRRRIAELEAEIAGDRAALAEGRRRCGDLLKRAGNEQDELAGLAAREQAVAAELAAAQADAAGLKTKAQALTLKIEAEKADVVEWARRLALVHNELGETGLHAKNVAANRGKLQVRADALRAEIEARSQEHAEHSAEVERLEGEIARLDGERVECKTEADRLAGRRAELAAELDAAGKELAKWENRRAVLRELEEQLEGVDAGVRDILRRSRGDVPSPPEGEGGRRPGEGDGGATHTRHRATAPAFGSVCGMVADFVRAGGRWVPVIEAALGRHLQSLVATRSDRLMADLAAAGPLPGQAHVFCLDRLPVVHDGLRLEGEPEFVGRPMDFVEVRPEARRVLEHLFARTIVVRSVAGAIRLLPKVPRGYRFVTLDGQVVGEDGSLELGGPAGRRGLLARKAELAELDGRVQAGQARVAELQSELSALGEAVRDLEQHQQDLRTAIYESATARAERQARRDQAGQALARAASEEPGLSAELTALERESAEVTARVDQLRRGAAELDLGKAAAEGRVAEAVAELERLRTLEGELAERIADLRVEASRSAQQRQSFAEQAAQLGSARRQAEESLEAARTRIARNVERLAEAERQVLSAEAERAGLYAAKDDADRQARERSVGRRGLPEQVAAAAETAKRLAAEAGELLAAVHKLEMTASEADVRADNLAVRVRDEYGLDLAAEYDRLIAGADRGESKVESAAPPAAGPESNVAAPEPVQGELFADRPAAAAESEEQPSDAGPSAEPVRPDPAMPIAAMLTSLSPEAARALAIQELENTDWAAVQEEINELRGKIERLGNVNLDSIAELEELEQRSGKMASQVQDLDTARKQLEELLGRLNKDSSELFVVTFAEVRKNFQELFRKLFGGGSADVFLEDESNPLECGIEIKARPPGKEPRSISLLSGGERTMTAVAMLMAVFRSRPSPFCILDEVDAALDEKNCERLGAVVKEFTDRSQFIVISHRKPTMVVADVMYGVTMQETGVSKKVAVRFNDHGQVISTDADGKEAEFKIEG